MKQRARGCLIVAGVLIVIGALGSRFSKGETPSANVARIADIAPTSTQRVPPTTKPTRERPTPQIETVVETETAMPVAPAIATVNTTANVRNVPRPEASTVLGTVETGATVQLLMKNADATWYGVTTPAGLTGWVSASLLTIDAAVASQVPEGTAEDLGVTVPEPAVEAPVEEPAAPARGATHPTGSDCPADFPVKGNQGDEWIYHVPGGRSYSNTKPEQCFATATEAEAAGYRAAKR